MSQNKDKNEELKKLKDAPLPAHIQKSVDQKIKHTSKPLSK